MQLLVCAVAEWDEFKTLDFKKIYSTMTKPAFVFDGEYPAYSLVSAAESFCIALGPLLLAQPCRLNQLHAALTFCCMTCGQRLCSHSCPGVLYAAGRNILDHAALREQGFVVYALGKPLEAFLRPAQF